MMKRMLHNFLTGRGSEGYRTATIRISADILYNTYTTRCVAQVWKALVLTVKPVLSRLTPACRILA